MSAILYYSFQCENTKQLIRSIAGSQIQNHIYFACIDKRVQYGSEFMIQLDNGENILLPGGIVRFPALVILSNYTILYGNEISTYIKPQQMKELQEATRYNMEPSAYDLTSQSSVISDTFSFLDNDHNQSQLYHYGSANPTQQVQFQEQDTFQVSGRQANAENGKSTMESLEAQRNAEIQPLSNNGDRPMPIY